jgi:hypothetical protein
MGIWIELGVFLLVFVFAAWQFHDLRKARAEREARQRDEREREAQRPGLPAADTAADGTPGSGSRPESRS